MDTSSDAAAASSQHAIDVNALQAWLTANMGGFSGPLELHKFAGGQSNPTYKLVTPGRSYVMRAKPGPQAKLLPSAHAIEREFRVMNALALSGVPVARMHVLCEDESVIGRAFYVMEYVEGRVFWEQSLPGLTVDERAAVYDEMNRVLAALHSVDIKAVGLQDFGKPGNYFARQIGRWSKQYQMSITEPIPEMDRLMAWLPEHMPASALDESQVAIVHGDYRLDNLIFAPDEPRIVAVLDWELSTLGHPLADIAYGCILYHSESESWGTLRGIDLAASGIPGEAEYVAAYCRRTGRSGIPDFNAYLAFSMFRLAAIGQGVYKRNLIGIGNAPASRDNSHTRHLAATACAILDR